ncbi:MAG: hypothetical protein H6579_04745 [Chitinophagales bacterium]|nr:hypothetical protein [Bacteroidota bacterium]MCB9256416.1 hypothetical protein [Chitinophagales bacterium]
MKKIIAFSLCLVVLLACNKDDDDTSICSGASCSYTLNTSAGEVPGSVPSALQGEHNLSASYASANSPFSDGTTGKFTLDGNVLTVEIENEACITLYNPYQSSFAEVSFVDDCRDNLIYSVSESSQGGLNEINVASLSGNFYCQFK